MNRVPNDRSSVRAAARRAVTMGKATAAASSWWSAASPPPPTWWDVPFGTLCDEFCTSSTCSDPECVDCGPTRGCLAPRVPTEAVRTRLNHVLVVPSHRLLLCRIEKVANTVLSSLMCSLNREHAPGARQPQHQALGDDSAQVFDFEAGCDWHTAEAINMRMSLEQIQDAFVTRVRPWTKVVFYRDPLERFLSAFLSKCTDGHDPEWDRKHFCAPIFGSARPTFEHVAGVVGRAGFEMQDGSAGDHWRNQVDFCGGLEGLREKCARLCPQTARTLIHFDSRNS